MSTAMSSALSTFFRRSAVGLAAVPSARAFSTSMARPDAISRWVTATIPNPSLPADKAAASSPAATNATSAASSSSSSSNSSSASTMDAAAPSQNPPHPPNPTLWAVDGDDVTGLSQLLRGFSDKPDPLTHAIRQRPRFTQAVRLAPSTGRTVHVGGNADAATALRMLNTKVRQNGLQKLVRLQRQHERPGLKRKRLKSERWRARFRQSFLATVSRVQELTKQGW